MPFRIPFFKPPTAGPIATPEDKSERNRFYAGTVWRRLRALFLADNPFCARCLAEGRGEVPADTVHHKAERLHRPDLALDPENLEAVCKSCHTTHHKTRRNP